MTWNRRIFSVRMVALLSFLCGCDPVPLLLPIPSPADRVYFNSFESPADTTGWRGMIDIRSDAPPVGGRQSAFISGGCIHPHAYREIPAVDADRSVVLRCWGKNLELGGSVELRVNPEISIPPFPSVSIVVDDPRWQAYRSDTLFCPANYPMQLSMSAGGIVPSSILIDMVEITRIEMATDLSDFFRRYQR